MTTYYLDTSVVARAVLGQSPSATKWLDDITREEGNIVFSSRILRTELTRVLRREGLPVLRRDAILDVISLVTVSDGVLAAAEAIEPHVKTLDAIHLGSVIAIGADAIIVTHDSGMASAAGVLGYRTFDPTSGD